MSLDLIPEQHNILWGTSWIAMYPMVMSIQNRKFDNAFFMGSVLLTSLNYWRKPHPGIRRTLDVILVKAGVMYFSYTSLKKSNYRFFIFCIPAVTSYYVGQYFYKRQKYWTYTYFHLGVHLLGNLANFQL